MVEDRQPKRNIPLGILIGLGATILASGGAAAWFTWRSINPSLPTVEFPTLEQPAENLPTPVEPVNPPAAQQPSDDTGQVKPEPPAVTAATEKVGEVFWLAPTETGFSLTPESIPLPDTDDPNEQLTIAFQSLLAGPADAAEVSVIPAGTEVLDVTVQPDGVHVNLSKAFTSGGGSASMQGRLGQVVFTATMLKPNDPVWLSVEGEPLTLLGGEGLEIPQPMTRKDFEANFSL